MLAALGKIFSLFTKAERRQMFWLFSAVVVRGVFEVAGVVSIMPFIQVVANPDIIQTNVYLSSVYNFFGFASPRFFLMALGFTVLTILIINNSLSALTDWFLNKFTWMRGHSLALRLFAKYLSQPYTYFLTRNTADLGANVLNEIGNYMKGVLRPLMDLIAKIIVSIFIFTLLCVIDPFLAVVVGVVLGGAYSVIFIIVRKKLSRIGKERVYHNRKQFLYINEALSGIKDIKVKTCEKFFMDLFGNHSYRVNMNQAIHQVVSQIPRYALEVVSFGGILLITIYFLLTREDASTTIPLIALYAFAGYRLMPALQGVFSGVTSLKFHIAILEKLSEDLDIATYPYEQIKKWKETPEAMTMEENIQLKGVTFFYPDTNVPVIDGLDINIPAKSTIGLVGTTGSGKSTLVDIVLGLFIPDSGSVTVDNVLLTEENRRSWLGNIGYVPQHIFLSDQSIRNNIALGTDPEEIDEEALVNAAKIANLHNFITEILPEGYNTIVGERGVRLSGGQRQRVGIARALYHDPDILIFDEATSSLDNVTEMNVMKAIKSLARKKTIIMIAHRLSTLDWCDTIHYMKNGRVLCSGTYTELIHDCEDFNLMAGDENNK